MTPETSTPAQEQASTQRPPRSPAEWATFSGALVILSTVVGLVVYQWFTQDQQPPQLAVTQSGEIRQSQGQFYVPFRVQNTGEATESVQVVAELRVRGQVEATGEQQIPFLSAGETANGAFVFNQNPRQGELTLRVASYQQP